jgi:hypothetical protein
MDENRSNEAAPDNPGPGVSHRFDFEDHVTKWSPRGSEHTHSYRPSETRHVILTLQNYRQDIASLRTIMQFNGIESGAENERKVENIIRDNTPLKPTNKKDYHRDILPGDEGKFDLLAFDVANPTSLYLVSQSDAHPRKPVISGVGTHRARFRAYSEGFPMVEIVVEVVVTGGDDVKVEVVPPAPLK